MTTNLNGLFAATEDGAQTAGARSLAGTAQLTTVANEITATIMKTIDNDLENYKESFAMSQTDHSAMDMLINSIYNIADVDVQFLKDCGDAMDNMLKSQQSKRSRAKRKVMTVDNYRNMMSGAVAELLLRQAMGKAKSASFGGRRSRTTDFTEEELAELAINQEQLRREIRNVQSKKSIMKSKEGFSEESEVWQLLVSIEEKLKAIRTEYTPQPKVVKVDDTKDKLAEMLDDVDPSQLKAGDVKALLAQVKALTQVPAEGSTIVVPDDLTEITPDADSDPGDDADYEIQE